VCKVSEGVRVYKLRRDSSFVITVEKDPGEGFEQNGALEQKKSSRRRINGQGSQRRIAKSR
jgi:hypothetical protein